MIIYKVSPQQAYAEDGYPNGDLMMFDIKCRSCGNRAAAYSRAGYAEIGISGMCEPCFDYVCASEDEREEWMKLVTYNKGESW